VKEDTVGEHQSTRVVVEAKFAMWYEVAMVTAAAAAAKEEMKK